jgi:Flp pilus assembly pilin Flp
VTGLVYRLAAGGRTWHAYGGRRAAQGERMRAILSFLDDDQGQGMTEYAIIIAVIALALLITQVFFADKIKQFFSNIGNMLT